MINRIKRFSNLAFPRQRLGLPASDFQQGRASANAFIARLNHRDDFRRRVFSTADVFQVKGDVVHAVRRPAIRNRAVAGEDAVEEGSFMTVFVNHIADGLYMIHGSALQNSMPQIENMTGTARRAAHNIIHPFFNDR